MADTPKPPLTLEDIIRRAGGARRLAEQSSEEAGGKFSHWAVYKWPEQGIPDRYWSLVCRLADVTVEQVFAACEAARQPTPAGAAA